MKVRIISVFIFTLLFSEMLHAHSMWLQADNYNPKVGENVTIEIGWGHGVNKKEPMRAGAFKKIYVIAPDGKIMTPKKVDNMHYRFRAVKPGYYAIGAEINSGFMTKTTTGRKMTSKKGIDNAVSCINYDIRSKTVIKAGNGNDDPGAKVAHPLEVVILRNAGNVNKNDSVELKVLFRGKPLADADVRATYESYKGKGHDAPVKVKTDSQGKASIKLTEKGLWIIQVKHDEPYPVKEECDNYVYNTSMTVFVR